MLSPNHGINSMRDDPVPLKNYERWGDTYPFVILDSQQNKVILQKKVLEEVRHNTIYDSPTTKQSDTSKYITIVG